MFQTGTRYQSMLTLTTNTLVRPRSMNFSRSDWLIYGRKHGKTRNYVNLVLPIPAFIAANKFLLARNFHVKLVRNSIYYRVAATNYTEIKNLWVRELAASGVKTMERYVLASESNLGAGEFESVGLTSNFKPKF